MSRTIAETPDFGLKYNTKEDPLPWPGPFQGFPALLAGRVGQAGGRQEQEGRASRAEQGRGRAGQGRVGAIFSGGGSGQGALS